MIYDESRRLHGTEERYGDDTIDAATGREINRETRYVANSQNTEEMTWGNDTEGML